MTADIVNLRQARKAKARAAGEKRAEENRVKFGRTKRERKELEASEALRVRRLEGHQRDAPSGDCDKPEDDGAA